MAKPSSKPAGAAQGALRTRPAAPQPAAKAKEAKPAPKLTPEERSELRNTKANYLEKLLPAGYLEATLGEATATDPDSFVFWYLLEKTLKQAGDPVDPIERMSIVMTTLAFHKSGQLLAKAAKADHLPAIEVYNSAATKMMGEFRRQSVALQEYRSTAAKPKLQVVGGQSDEAAAKSRCTA